MEIDIHDPNFWGDLWEQERNHRKHHEYQAERWNRRAESYAKQTGDGVGSQRFEETMQFFEDHGISRDQFTGMRILDIGSGPGNFAIPFAALGAEVWAFDPAEKMIQLLHKRAAEKKQTVSTSVELWEEIDIAERGWEGYFDLAFASMSPGIHSKETLEKMMAVSRQYCYLSSFAGPREYPIQQEIAKAILGENYKGFSPDIIYPFNLLYAMGYRPAVSFQERDSEQWLSREDIFEEIASHIAHYEPLTKEREGQINDLLTHREVEGKIRKTVKSRTGMLLWKVR